jgi:hypothetical protein
MDIVEISNKAFSQGSITQEEAIAIIDEYCKLKNEDRNNVLNAVMTRRLDITHLLREYWTINNKDYTLTEIIYKNQLIKQYLTKQ